MAHVAAVSAVGISTNRASAKPSSASTSVKCLSEKGYIMLTSEEASEIIGENKLILPGGKTIPQSNHLSKHLGPTYTYYPDIKCLKPHSTDLTEAIKQVLKKYRADKASAAKSAKSASKAAAKSARSSGKPYRFTLFRSRKTPKKLSPVSEGGRKRRQRRRTRKHRRRH
jgi:hypothetical protein